MSRTKQAKGRGASRMVRTPAQLAGKTDCAPAMPRRKYDCVHYDFCLERAARANSYALGCTACPKYEKTKPAGAEPAHMHCIKCGKAPAWLAGECKACHTARIEAIKKRNQEKIFALHKPQPEQEKAPMTQPEKSILDADPGDSLGDPPPETRLCAAIDCSSPARKDGPYCGYHTMRLAEGGGVMTTIRREEDAAQPKPQDVETAEASANQDVVDESPEDAPPAPKPGKGCKVPGCNRKHKARGLCSYHRAAWQMGRLPQYGPFEYSRAIKNIAANVNRAEAGQPVFKGIIERAQAAREAEREKRDDRILALSVLPFEKNTVTVDFSDYPDALENLKSLAKKNIRSLPHQLLAMCAAAYAMKGEVR